VWATSWLPLPPVGEEGPTSPSIRRRTWLTLPPARKFGRFSADTPTGALSASAIAYLDM